ncbi:MAG: long-chain fatty acid--CoA ligase [Immundisolibacter sp.]|uniref:long-chain fatty acid--CoA ligase n=1 Tax=Immundisolibacter sp. TaxID=1934948 RepID=UPI003D11B152
MELNIRLLLERSAKYFPGNEIVTRLPDGSLHRYTYRDLDARARRLASRLASLGIHPGDRVATFAWNTYRHFELYFALPCAGTVLHTVNLRLADEHVVYILNHSEDRAVFVDPDLLPTFERIVGELKTVRTFVVLADRVPPTTLPNVVAYEDLIRDGDPEFPFHELPERTPAGMCYTSATTGMPKGVIYTHRDIYLHTITECLGDVLDICERDTLLPVVPMFHANAWGLPFAAACMGAKMVLPGERPHAPVILDLMQAERVTFAAAAVSIGIDMVAELKRQPRDLSSMRGLMLGGSATPAAVMEFFLKECGFPVLTAWGSTEMTPLATCVHIGRELLQKPAIEHIPTRVRQGIPCPGTELKVLDEHGRPVPWDDQAIGEIYVRTPWSTTEYYRDERTRDGFVDGFWKSGDMSAVSPDGVLRLVDRAKDLIKSGGEWISSVDLENALVSHPQVREAAVVAAPDDKWLERPCAYVVTEPGATVGPAELRAWLEPKFAKWWLPDHYLIVDAIPKTGVGKINKRALREQVEQDLRQSA